MWWANKTGCARCIWVYPGMRTAELALAVWTNAERRARRASIASPTTSLTYRRTSVATWSLRERAVWSLPATAPIFSKSRFSMFM